MQKKLFIGAVRADAGGKKWMSTEAVREARVYFRVSGVSRKNCLLAQLEQAQVERSG